MNAKIIKKEKNIVSIEFAVSSENFGKAIDKAYFKLRNKVAIKGFRKGKAPKHIIEKMYGKNVFYDDAMDIVLYEEYPTVIKELDLNPINKPQIDVKEIEEGKDVIFTADIEVMPEVELGQYKGIEIEKSEYNVTDEDVEKEISSIQEKNARMIEVKDRDVKDGDTLTIDYTGFTGDVQFEGGTAQNQTLVIGSKTFIPGFEEQLIGKKIDEEVKVNVTFPEEYNAKELAGKDATFKVIIHEIKEKELPNLDDEFAKDVSEFDTLDELKVDTRTSLEKEAKEKEITDNNNKAVEKVVNDSNVEVPEVLVDREIEYQAKNYEQQFRSQGFAGKEVEDIISNLVKQYKENYKEQAVFNVKTDMVLNAIIEKENIEVTEEELNEELKKLAEAYKIEDDKFEGFKESVLGSSKEYIEESIQKRKIVDMIVNEAKFVTK
ncbi:trigger factor [Sedimentibacter sp. zth1]|uniref:trigger factor n=1 Tax=Sedimentibacter sp. zth1 TaxID=2816908 RepID=UPI001A918A40|nr:trigger factor [Sedimentibacter sp. zth1]QSX06903.1 trigger factor [Sedimentibacter sp. zth1]